MAVLFLQHSHLAADNDELGTPITISAFAGFSKANVYLMLSYCMNIFPAIVESGLANKYIP